MQFSTIIAAVATLAFGANAAVIQRDGDRLAQFRAFGANGCNALNYGFYLVDTSDANKCNTFAGVSGPVKSVNLEALTAAAAGCTLVVHADSNCADEGHTLALQTCNDVSSANDNWQSWSMNCS